MNPYKYNVIFRLEKRLDASGDYPINADITFGGKRIFFFTGCKVDESQWNKTTQQMKRNNFNRSGISATDINNRLIKIRAAIDSVFADFEHKEIVATPKSLREAIRKELDEEKTARMTIAECYQLLIDEREKELKERPATAQWTLSTLKKHKTMLRHFNDFNKTLYFEDLTQALLLEFEVFLISKGLSNGYVAKSLVDVKTFLNWATAQGYNTSTAYKGFTGKFKDETKNGSLDDHFALNQEELTEVINVQTYYALYFGIAKHLRQRLNWHINQKHNPSAVKSGFLSTLRQTISALLALPMTQSEKSINDLIDTSCYLEYWHTPSREAAEGIERDEITNNYYPLNVQGNKGVGKEVIRALTTLRGQYKR